jgi:hypothetical protein
MKMENHFKEYQAKTEAIKIKIGEHEANLQALQTKYDEMESLLVGVQEMYSVGECTQAEYDKAKKIVQEKKDEIEEFASLLRAAKRMKAKYDAENLPIIRQFKEAQIKRKQSAYEKQASIVLASRDQYLKDLAKLGTLRSDEFAVKPLNSPNGYTAEKDCVGITVERQGAAYGGHVPQWIQGGE